MVIFNSYVSLPEGTMINPFLLIDILSSIKFNLMETGNNAVQIAQEQGIVPKSDVVWFINPMN